MADDVTVPGVKVLLSVTELERLLKERATYHSAKAAQKEEQLPKLEEAWAAIKINPIENQPGLHSNTIKGYQSDLGSQIEALKEDIKVHRNKSNYFTFLSQHLFPRDYCLEEADLLRLEIVRR